MSLSSSTTLALMNVCHADRRATLLGLHVYFFCKLLNEPTACSEHVAMIVLFEIFQMMVRNPPPWPLAPCLLCCYSSAAIGPFCLRPTCRLEAQRARFTRPTTRAHTFACARLLRSPLAPSPLAPSVAPPSVAPATSAAPALLVAPPSLIHTLGSRVLLPLALLLHCFHSLYHHTARATDARATNARATDAHSTAASSTSRSWLCTHATVCRSVYSSAGTATRAAAGRRALSPLCDV